MSLYIVHPNPWHDYCGGSDHQTIAQARECTETAEDGTKLPHIVLIPLESLADMIEQLGFDDTAEILHMRNL